MPPNDRPPIAMAPAYGGMFRPRAPSRWPIVVGVMLVVIVFGAISVGGFLILRARRATSTARTGMTCNGSSSCGADYLCIHEADGTSSCANLCKRDDDCPASFVCEKTLTGRHTACMKSGVSLGGGRTRRTR